MEKARKSATLTVRTAPDVKQKASEIYKEQYGLSLSDAVNMFLYQTVTAGHMPFGMNPPKNNTQSLSQK